MVVRTQDENFNAESLQAIGIVLQQGDPESLSLDPLRGEMRDFCRRVVVNEKFRAEAGSSLVIPLADKNVRCVVLAGTGSDAVEGGGDDVGEHGGGGARGGISRYPRGGLKGTRVPFYNDGPSAGRKTCLRGGRGRGACRLPFR